MIVGAAVAVRHSRAHRAVRHREYDDHDGGEYAQHQHAANMAQVNQQAETFASMQKLQLAGEPPQSEISLAAACASGKR